ncbi:hypothetical protein MTBBW1_2730002 [Desulfamplus magnetovallimortis]|uniref:DUF3102 domain-containing protein n=1 Tax=Desulfamplus magnetovallimortis TaxID=1246637 RepID=A0A1W1HFH8_9BACT|nr:DUF3102 domain-containing protein [Desulfamplus magnetovallimortis]SLM31132.1 hypothetical protein MTBBW1_2730002 [Desulfamplus magnetovallimortis]
MTGLSCKNIFTYKLCFPFLGDRAFFVSKSIVAIGNELIQIKEKLGHGNWLPWIEKCFEGSERTAQSFMQAAKKHSNTHHGADLNCNTRATRTLAAKSTSNDILDAAFQLQEEGGEVTEKWVKENKA